VLLVFFGAYLLTQYVSLGSVLAATAFSVSFVLLHWQEPVVMVCGVVMGGMAIFMHRGNIVRLLKGQERKTNLFEKGEKK
jgi:glycerol-3-phosphate acyltransferase PlsY